MWYFDLSNDYYFLLIVLSCIAEVSIGEETGKKTKPTPLIWAFEKQPKFMLPAKLIVFETAREQCCL